MLLGKRVRETREKEKESGEGKRGECRGVEAKRQEGTER